MRIADTDYLMKLHSGAKIVNYATFTLYDGTILNLKPKDFRVSGNSYEDKTQSGSEFAIGAFVGKTASISLDNSDGSLDGYDFYMSKFILKESIQVDEDTVKHIEIGTFTVVTDYTPGEIISFSGVEYAYKFDKVHNLTGTKTLKQIISQACTQCLGSSTFDATGNFDLYNTQVDTSKLDAKLTWRQIVSYVAQMAGYIAYMTVGGNLAFKWYDFSAFNISGLDGGTFNTTTTPYSDGDDADGGDFNFNEASNYDGGLFTDTVDFHIIQSYKNPQIGTYDISITGIRVVNDDTTVEKLSSHSYNYSYVIEVNDNPLTVGIEETVATHLKNKIVDMTFRTFDCDILCDPTIEAGDVALIIDTKGREYKTMITRVEFSTNAFTHIACEAESIIRQQSSYTSEEARAIAEANRVLDKTMTSYDESVQRMNELSINSGGMYTGRVLQEDGSYIYYSSDHEITYWPDGSARFVQHSFVAKNAGNGYFYSTDSGTSDLGSYAGSIATTWTGGLDKNGNAVLHTLAVYKLQAEWIVAGLLSDSQMANYWNFDTGEFRLSASAKVGSGNDTVQSIADTSAAAAQAAAEATAAAALANAVAVIDGDISDLQDQIDGNITTWFYDYEPKTNNAPANTWTTVDEKINHIGDLFYWSSKGYCYRWQVKTTAADPTHPTANDFEWVQISDSEISKALANAQKAQDTADAKRRIFITQPTPPYDAGDTWMMGTTGDIKTCINSRSSGSYVASDWSKLNKYTDDSSLETFIDDTYTPKVGDLQTQIDGKVETFYQSSDPSTSWTSDDKAKHVGDLWYKTTDNTTWIYRYESNAYSWKQENVPNEVFNQINGKAQIFTSTPTTPYRVGDLWCEGTSGDIKTCITQRLTGNYNSADWAKRNKYTDDSALTAFQNGTYATFVTNTNNALNGKITTFYQTSAPTAVVAGDLWIDTDDGNKLYRWSGSQWVDIQDNGIQSALTAASNAQTTADGKIVTYAQASAPTGTLDTGDLWIDTDDNNKLYRWSGSAWVAYSDSSALTSWITNTYTSDKQTMQQQIDGKIETYYQTSDPSTAWTTTALKNQHTGDMWYNSTSSVQKYYRWSGTAWVEVTATPPSEVFDEIDGKAQIFINQPTTPYAKGDLWFNSTSSEIKVCVTARATGNYTASDWAKRDKYTDDSALTSFKNGDYATFVTNTTNSLNAKITTFYQTSQPTAVATGDLWIDTDDGNKLYRWNGSQWKNVQDSGIQTALTNAATAQTTADGKIVTFAQTSQPTATDVGDLWIDTDDNNKLYRWSGSAWVAYSDSSALNTWITNTYTGDKTNLQSQIDGKAETWYQSADPSSAWTTTALKDKHLGDLWYDTDDNTTWYYQKSGSTYSWVQQNVPNAVFDKIDGKAQIFTSQPTPPYSVGDLWFNSSSSDIMTCTTARASGNYTASDWEKRNKYTDDSAVIALDAELDQDEIFDRLTGGGQNEGIYLDNGHLYINASKILTGILDLGGASTDNPTIRIKDSSGNEIGTWTRDGIEIKNSSGTTIFKITAAGVMTISGYATTSSLSAYATNSSLANGTTTISGGCITTGVINANLITSGTLSANRVRAGILESENYSKSSSNRYATRGFRLNLSDGSIVSPAYSCSGTDSIFYARRLTIAANNDEETWSTNYITVESRYNDITYNTKIYPHMIKVGNTSSQDGYSLDTLGGLNFSGGWSGYYSAYLRLTPTELSMAPYYASYYSKYGIFMNSSSQIIRLLDSSGNETEVYVGAIYRTISSVTTSVEWTGSDRRIKKNIEDLSVDLSVEFINRTEPKTFAFNNEDDGTINYGMIAQEAREILDDLGETTAQLEYSVGDTNIKDQRDIHYYQYIPHLINYVKDLRSEIEELKAEIKALKEG